MYSLGHDKGSWLAELGGANWGLLPALLFLPCLLVPLGPQAPHSSPSLIFVLLAALMASHDVASYRIPNPLTALTALTGLTISLAQGGLAGLGWAALGGLTGFALLAVFFFLGAMGAGDVKALGALSCFLTPLGALELFMLTALMGGALAIARLIIARQRVEIGGMGLGGLRLNAGGHQLPYGLAIFAAALALALQGGLA